MEIYGSIRTVHDLDELGLIEAALTFFDDWLTALDITVEAATQFFVIDYFDAKCAYNDLIIPTIGKKVAAINAKKYDKMVAIYSAEYNPLENYNRVEESSHTRTPDLTKTETHDTETVVDSDGSTDSTINQTRTTTTTPTNYTTTTTKSVAPYDTTTMQDKEQDTSVLSGSTATTDAYTGQPDHTASELDTTTTVTGDITTTETGTDTTEIESSIHGNIGVMSTQQMAEQELALAAKMAIFNTIKQDLARDLLIQVW